MVVTTCDPRTKQGFLLPLGEEALHNVVRGIIYAVLMVYFFLGVAMIADTFVCSIEVVTSRWKRVRLKSGHVMTVKRWNETVANLSLMALGSSAPEICLSFVELINKEMHVGQLGPSTIVGSASFNLLIIVGVCVMVIPNGEDRIIKEIPAFYVTAAFSVFAYGWLLGILVVMTPHIVTIWEALMTFLFFPLLVWISYKIDVTDLADISWLRCFNTLFMKALGEDVARERAWRKNRQSSLRRTSTCKSIEQVGSQSTIGSTHTSGNGQSPYTSSNSNFSINGTSNGSDHQKSNGNGDCENEVDEDGESSATIQFSQRIYFTSPQLEIQGTSEKQTIEVEIIRGSPAKGPVSCSYRTSRISAVPGYDFTSSEGTLEFADGEMKQTLDLEIPPSSGSNVKREFLVVLENIDGEAEFNPDDDGGVESAILTVALRPGGGGGFMQAVDACCNLNELRWTRDNWVDQIIEVRYCNGSPEEQADASALDWAFHILCLPWKVVFIIVPPPCWLGGWACFYGSLLVIFAVTAVLCDLAELFGCVLGVPDIVTAVSFVALGTSVPDLFASITAAKEDETADTSVVNVTGSNSVNVFLGLGAPWTLATIYWKLKGRPDDFEERYGDIAKQVTGSAFIVESKNLGFSVFVFSGCCFWALLVLLARRKYLGAELGGPFYPKLSTLISFVMMWIGYIFLVSWRVIRCAGASEGHWCKASVMEQLAVSGTTALVLLIFLSITFVSIFKNRQWRSREQDSVASSSSSEAPTSECKQTEVLDPPPDLEGAVITCKPEQTVNGMEKSVGFDDFIPEEDEFDTRTPRNANGNGTPRVGKGSQRSRPRTLRIPGASQKSGKSANH